MSAHLPELLHQPVVATASLSPQRPAVVDGPRVLTYGELDIRSNKVARLLVDECGNANAADPLEIAHARAERNPVQDVQGQRSIERPAGLGVRPRIHRAAGECRQRGGKGERTQGVAKGAVRRIQHRFTFDFRPVRSPWQECEGVPTGASGLIMEERVRCARFSLSLPRCWH